MKQKQVKNLKLFVIIIVLVIITANNVYSLGIAPSKKIMDYDNQEHTINVRIINNEARNVKIILSAQGTLAEYVTIPESILNILSTEPEKEFTYNYKLPHGLETGTQTIEIVASEIDDSTSTNSVNALLTITHQLQINIPYPRKQIEGHVSITTTTINDPIITRLTLKNNGIENISSITGILKILDQDNKIMFVENIQEQTDIIVGTSLNIDRQITLEKIGRYTADYKIYYDEKELSIRKDFEVGEYNIAVLETKVDNFRLGTIAKFDVKLTTEWNTAIDNIYSELTIKDKNGTVIGQTNTAKSRILPGTDNLVMYWDTKNITTGDYLLNLKIYSDEKILTYEYNTKITENKIIINPQLTELEKPQITNNNINSKIIGIIIIIALAGIILLIVTKKKK